MEKHNFPKDVTNIVLHIILIGCFISVFFFIYITHVEEIQVEKEVEEIVSEFIPNLDILNEEQKNTVRMYVNKIEPPNMEEMDKEVENYNNNLRNSVYKGVGILLLVTVIFAYIMSVKYDFAVKDLIIDNIIILIAVGLTEYLFITYIVMKYKIGDANYVKWTIIDAINNQKDKNI